VDNLVVVILAAGLGTRMKSKRVKVLHPLLGRPLIAYPLAAARALNPKKIIVIVGTQAADVKAVCKQYAPDVKCEFVTQDPPRGTGDALRCALPAFAKHDGPLLILSGDVPAISDQTLNNSATLLKTSHAAAVILTTHLDHPTGYGRILRDEERQWAGMVEEADATPEQRKVTEINSGIYFIDAAALAAALPRITAGNAQKEFYLTDCFKLIHDAGGRIALSAVADPGEVAGINDRVQLAAAAFRLRRQKNQELMRSGVTLIDPHPVFVEWEVEVGADSVIHPLVTIEGKSVIGENCIIRSGAVIRDSTLGEGTEIREGCVISGAIIGKNCRIGPFAHLRAGSVLADDVHIGNFVETKQTSIGKGTKANHLSYLGDAELGAGVNIGAGTITCNYDGVEKHRTVIKDGVFVGSDTAIVAPRTIGARSVIGAGSVVRSDVPPDTLHVTMGTKKEIKDHPIVKAIAAHQKRKKKKV
jgi:bifunctional UDP-N-acetylglucosamine pyrophosphorylase/glucosamine-1-phosphate N-acetyltransferase